MSDHLRDIQRALEILDGDFSGYEEIDYSPLVSPSAVPLVESYNYGEDLDDELVEDETNDFLYEELVEDLRKLTKKLSRLTENSKSKDYQEGYEQGLYEASQHIKKLLKRKYGVRI